MKNHLKSYTNIILNQIKLYYTISNLSNHYFLIFHELSHKIHRPTPGLSRTQWSPHSRLLPMASSCLSWTMKRKPTVRRSLSNMFLWHTHKKIEKSWKPGCLNGNIIDCHSGKNFSIFSGVKLHRTEYAHCIAAAHIDMIPGQHQEFPSPQEKSKAPCFNHDYWHLGKEDGKTTGKSIYLSIYLSKYIYIYIYVHHLSSIHI